jgi:hypothetical protein
VIIGIEVLVMQQSIIRANSSGAVYMMSCKEKPNMFGRSDVPKEKDRFM